MAQVVSLLKQQLVSLQDLGSVWGLVQQEVLHAILTNTCVNKLVIQSVEKLMGCILGHRHSTPELCDVIEKIQMDIIDLHSFIVPLENQTIHDSIDFL